MFSQNYEETSEKVLDLPLSKQGNSLAVVVPATVLRKMNLGSGDWVRVVLREKKEED